MEAYNDLKLSHDNIEANNVTKMSILDTFLPGNFVLFSLKNQLSHLKSHFLKSVTKFSTRKIKLFPLLMLHIQKSFTISAYNKETIFQI